MQHIALLRQLLGDPSHPDMMWITSSPLIKAEPTLKAILDLERQVQIAVIQETQKAE
jgi:hypothetical protein